MLSTVTVNYRGAQSRTLSNLSRINVVTGRGAGKTSFLQGVSMLLHQHGAVAEMCRLLQTSLGEMVSFGFARPVYASGVLNGTAVSLSAETTVQPRGYVIRTESGEVHATLQGTYVSVPNGVATCPCVFLTNARRDDPAGDALVWMQKVDANVTSVSTRGGRLSVRWKNYPVSVRELTSTLQFVLRLAGAFESARNGVLLVDCFGDGIHPDVQPILAEMVHTLAEKYNVQVFLVTQSLEAIEALCTHDVKLYSFAAEDVVEFSGEEVRGIREVSNLDPRCS